MKTLVFRTNFRCSACVETIRPELDAIPGLTGWSANVIDSDKLLTLQGEDFSLPAVEAALQRHGYSLLGPVSPQFTTTSPEPPTSYFPLALILAYLIGICGCVELATGSFDPMRAMNHFMAGFFLVFSFFKLLNLTAFAEAYAGYDLLARRLPAYGRVYPFVELLLGLAYLSHFWPVLTNACTLVVMGFSTLGVANTLLSKQRIRCACLGTVFNLPMSAITLVEDLLMVGMAAAMLILLLK